MPPPSLTTSYISIGAARVPSGASVSPSSIVAYAADRYVALWRPSDEKCRVRTLLKGHLATVKVVHFVADDVLVSGSVDGEVRIWRHTTPISSTTTADDEDEYAFECTTTLTFHTGAIQALSTTPDGAYLVVGSSDANASVWYLPDLTTTEKHLPRNVFTLDAGNFPLCFAIDVLCDGEETGGERIYILAVGTTSTKIYIYITTSLTPLSLRKVAVLRGHDDWVQTLAYKNFTTPEGALSLYLASGSQDRYIRLWQIQTLTQYKEAQHKDSLFIADSLLTSTMYKFTTAGEHDYVILFDALLMGHDDWILSLQWHPAPNRFALVSASADSSLIIWTPDAASGIWVSSARLGDVSIKGSSSATGSSGGFWTALWNAVSNDEFWVATIGKSGGWRVWTCADAELSSWTPRLAVTGHAREVTCVSWEPSGEYLLTTSLDQTTRLFAESLSLGWYEFARPQIHGYDMLTVVSLTSTTFVSAGDEKTLRVFEMPRGVALVLRKQCGFSVADGDDEEQAEEMLADAANVPSLGLSNKAITNTTPTAPADYEETDDHDSAPTNTPLKTLSDLTTPPFESILQRHTLFAERDKLYGHGYELSCAAVSHSGTLLATACRANTPAHAVIRLFDTHTWQECTRGMCSPMEEAHSLTITALRFSSDDKFLVSVGRDRMLAVWEREDSTEGVTYKLTFSAPRGHARIIWDAAWCPDIPLFATASRDKTVKLWSPSTDTCVWNCSATLRPGTNGVTAVTFTRTPAGATILAAGLDDGGVVLYSIADSPTISAASLVTLPTAAAPCRRISQLAFRPHSIPTQLALASEDTSVRLYTLALLDS
ncbi:WD40-repeat-containing domain protein [Limtongia smithiae]|uniref:WD40-repeat-containing domain protein n=1 Tax=Limtongia smithiae TaxID=1125753 RepID=UPI0034CED890